MKNGRFTLPEKLQGKQGRTLLAVGIGLLAMVLILLSELFPARQTTAAAGEKLDTAAYPHPYHRCSQCPCSLKWRSSCDRLGTRMQRYQNTRNT